MCKHENETFSQKQRRRDAGGRVELGNTICEGESWESGMEN